MKNPICPNCTKSFSLIDGFRMVNPWKIKCRNCGAILEGGGWQKVELFAGFGTGVAIAGIARWQREAGNWDTPDSLIWYAASLTILFLAGLAFWSRHTLTIKRDE